MFWRFAELSQPVEYTLGDSTETHALMMRERADLVRDIPEEIRRLMALAETQPIGKPDDIAPGHNPDRLTNAQVGEGWRLLEIGEKQRLSDQWWDLTSWVPNDSDADGCLIRIRTCAPHRRRVEVRP